MINTLPEFPGSSGAMPAYVAQSHIYDLSSTGRRKLPHNGIRWNITANNGAWTMGAMQYMTWPNFIAANGEPVDGALETELTYKTYLYPLSFNSLADWMVAGAKFFFMEGGIRVGEGQITKVLDVPAHCQLPPT